jgi:hypothetical protein
MRPRNVLVIEDEAVIAMDLEEKLRKLGYQVVGQGTTGEEAVEQASEMRPDLILMDIRFKQGIDGIDAARTIRQRLDLPVVYVTAYSDDATVERAKLTEPLAYILKPIDERELRVTLEMALYKHAAETERKRAKEALRASEERYRVLVEGSIQGVCLHKDAIIQFANTALAGVFGYESPAEVIGQHYSVLVAPHERARLEGYRTARLRGEPVPSRYEFQGVRKDGTLVWIEVLVSVISWPREPAVLGTFVDITERKETEDKLRHALDQLGAAQAQLVSAERLAAVAEMAGQLAHHLNNLLAVVVARIELALDDRDASNGRRCLKIAQQAGMAAAEVVWALQRSSRMPPGLQAGPLNLNELVREVLELVGGVSPAGMPDTEIAVCLEPGELPEICGDRNRLREALLNLLMNALEALPGRGRVVVRTWASGPWVHCSVADTGVGMSGEVQAQALEPFFTTKGLQRTGLGLSIAHGVIRQHGGVVSVESVEGRGTTVIFALPVAPEPIRST